MKKIPMREINILPGLGNKPRDKIDLSLNNTQKKKAKQRLLVNPKQRKIRRDQAALVVGAQRSLVAGARTERDGKQDPGAINRRDQVS